MPEEPFARYDSADYLNSEDAIATYLEVVRDEAGDDPAILAHALEVIARARRGRLRERAKSYAKALANDILR